MRILIFCSRQLRFRAFVCAFGAQEFMLLSCLSDSDSTFFHFCRMPKYHQVALDCWHTASTLNDDLWLDWVDTKVLWAWLAWHLSVAHRLPNEPTDAQCFVIFQFCRFQDASQRRRANAKGRKEKARWKESRRCWIGIDSAAIRQFN